jgi:5,10-methylene-tetrahydrofolate dehydrogenase/methenyl tetrahydrofolate cyclohydrolase
MEGIVLIHIHTQTHTHTLMQLPQHVDEAAVLGAISLNKDVDGFHPFNIGRLAMKVIHWMSNKETRHAARLHETKNM